MRGRTLAGCVALAGLCGALLGAGIASAQEFTGYGDVTFGASETAAKKRYPAARAVGQLDNLGAPFLGGAHIDRLILDKQSVAGLPKPTTVELRFWKDQLWGVIVYFGDNTDQQVTDLLTKRLGPSQSKDPTRLTWVGTKTQTSATIKQRWYGVTDLALSKEAQAWLAGELRKKPHEH